jgi:para-nitrobenzyl esterase
MGAIFVDELAEIPDGNTVIFDRTCEIRRNFDHELVKKLVETEYNPMTPVVEDEEEDAFFIH